MADAASTTSSLGAATPAKQPPSPAQQPATSAVLSSDSVIISKLTSQVKKLTESNAKYKNLLKLAKERIQQQEEELEQVKTALEVATRQQLEQQEQLQEQKQASEHNSSSSNDQHHHASSGGTLEADNDDGASTFIVRVCQRVKVPAPSNRNNNGGGGGDEIWALMELEKTVTHDLIGDAPVKRYREWQKFESESQLQDAIRRDTGEPLVLPPFSLTAEQSQKIQKQAKQEMAAVQEEFRRFRVKAELARKQADAHIRDLQNLQKQSAAQQIEGGSGSSKEDENYGNATTTASAAATSNGSSSFSIRSNTARGVGQQQRAFLESQVEKLQGELASQEAYWKEAYNTLLAENQALKSSGSEALLASQWRQRYETCKQENAELQKRFQQQQEQFDSPGGGATTAISYESKYRDLKESFRMYRKKAKELFEASAAGTGGLGIMMDQQPNPLEHSPFLQGLQADGSADAKLGYLRNLMVNYFTAEATVKPHMEGAIGTLLQFSQEDVERIEKKRAEDEAWLF